MLREFLKVFNGKHKNDIAKACDWWKKRDSILAIKQKSISVRVRGGIKRVELKAAAGRGKKCAEWVVWLHKETRS